MENRNMSGEVKKKKTAIHFWAQAQLHPPLWKKSKQILENFKKFPFFCVVDNLMREVRSNFQIIWTSEQLSAKKTNSGSVKMFTVHALFWPDLSFLLRASQKSKWSKIWSVPHVINCLPCKKRLKLFEFFLIFLWFFPGRVQMSLGTETPHSKENRNLPGLRSASSSNPNFPIPKSIRCREEQWGIQLWFRASSMFTLKPPATATV